MYVLANRHDAVQSRAGAQCVEPVSITYNNSSEFLLCNLCNIHFIAIIEINAGFSQMNKIQYSGNMEVFPYS